MSVVDAAVVLLPVLIGEHGSGTIVEGFDGDVVGEFAFCARSGEVHGEAPLVNALVRGGEKGLANEIRSGRGRVDGESGEDGEVVEVSLNSALVKFVKEEDRFSDTERCDDVEGTSLGLDKVVNNGSGARTLDHEDLRRQVGEGHGE